MEKQSEQMLDEVYKSAAFGKLAAERVRPAVSDPRLIKELERQQKGYAKVAGTAEVYLGMTGKNPPILNPISGAMLEAGLYAGLIRARNDNKRIIKMAEKGSRAGLRNMQNLMAKGDSSCCGYELAERLLREERQNLRRLKEL